MIFEAFSGNFRCVHRQRRAFYASIIKAFCNSRGSGLRANDGGTSDGNREEKRKMVGGGSGKGEKRKKEGGRDGEGKVERAERFRVSLCVKLAILVLYPRRDRSLGLEELLTLRLVLLLNAPPKRFPPCLTSRLPLPPFRFDIS